MIGLIHIIYRGTVAHIKEFRVTVGMYITNFYARFQFTCIQKGLRIICLPYTQFNAGFLISFKSITRLQYLAIHLVIIGGVNILNAIIKLNVIKVCSYLTP